MMFLAGVFALTRSTASYTLAIEFASESSAKTINMLIVVSDGFMTIIAGLCFYLSPDMITQYIVLAVVAAVCLSILVTIIPESPDYLFNHDQFEKLEQCLMKVASVNKVEEKEVLVP